MRYDREKERFIMDVPTECPRCGCKLGVDTRYVGKGELKTFLVCPNIECDYKLDASEEYEKASEAYNDEDNEDDE